MPDSFVMVGGGKFKAVERKTFSEEERFQT